MVLRLSSLGDVILAASVLESPHWANAEIEWVVNQKFADVLKGHPRIAKLHIFDRTQGLRGWLSLCKKLYQRQFTEIVDLHGSLRTRVLKTCFRFWNLKDSWAGRVFRGPRILSISKQRWRFGGHFFLKKLWPRGFRPKPWLDVFSKLVGAPGRLVPRMNHLLTEEKYLERSQLKMGQRFLAIMPSSAWQTKEWPVEHWVEMIRESRDLYFPVVLGLKSDRSASNLVARLASEGMAHQSFVGKLSLRGSATLIAQCDAFLGCDTGLFHLASALQVPSYVLLGPTTEDSGYPPWGAHSAAFGVNLGCRPCSKSGAYCHRLVRKQLCLNSLQAEDVLYRLSCAHIESGAPMPSTPKP